MLINKDNHSSNSSKYHRHSLRIKNYNYSIPGAYFITIATYLKENLLGYISEGKIELNLLGKITATEWLKTFQIRKNIQFDEYVIMPNHFHGIIIVLTNNSRGVLYTPNTGRGVLQYAPTNKFRSPSQTIGSIVRGFKSAVSRKIKGLDYPLLYSIWQRNYYEHIIRNENELNRIREYIQNNPVRWEYDRENGEGKPDEIEKKFWKDFI
jgi:REP element-mobilizing transposase RayT